MAKTVKLLSFLLPDTIVDRNYVIKRPILKSLSASGVYEIALLDFTPHAATIKHTHTDDHELMVNLYNCEVTICPQNGVHCTENNTEDYIKYLSVKSRHVFSEDHLSRKNNVFRLIPKHIPEECIEGNYVTEWIIYDNPGSLATTRISLLSFGHKSSLIINGDNEHNVMLINTETYTGLIIPKNESMTIQNDKTAYASYIKIESLVPFGSENYK